MSNSAVKNIDSGSNKPALPQHFKGIVAIPPDGKTYNIERWAPLVARRAAYVIYPTSAEDISAAILFARSQNLPIAIAGGRHDCGGASSVEGGVVIDMRNMNAVRVDKENKVGYLQGGITIHPAVQELYKYGLTTTLGMCGSVGVVGFVVGGGLGFRIGEYGLGCDNVVSATMVLANGDIVNVDEKENSDLLWGIKGGGSNFGVIAELGMKLHEPWPEVCTIEYIYTPEQLPALVDELSAWLQVQTPAEFLYLTLRLSPQDGKPYLILGGMSTFGAEDGKRLWGRFLRIGPVMSKTAQIPYNAYSAQLDAFIATPGNKIACGAHFNNFDYETVKKACDMMVAVTLKAPMSVIIWEFYYYDLVPTVPMEATAFPQRTKDKTALVALIGFADVWLLEARRNMDAIQAVVSSSSTGSARTSIGYLNYADILGSENETDANARRAYESNYPRLQELKRKYDPEMVFNKWFCIRLA
ncbi:hypothetical protein FRB93_006394 [Tulasnella sp. JGI-2019a]|nr:hypothetical protein FRB93_006394 [Tulasnella sp. JGI-2019a]